MRGHCGDVAYVPAGFHPLGDQRIGAHPLQPFCQRHRRNHRDDDDAGLLEGLDVWGGIPSAGGDDGNLLLDAELEDFFSRRGEQRHVHPERLIGALTDLVDLFPHVIRGSTARPYDPQAAGL